MLCNICCVYGWSLVAVDERTGDCVSQLLLELRQDTHHLPFTTSFCFLFGLQNQAVVCKPQDTWVSGLKYVV